MSPEGNLLRSRRHVDLGAVVVRAVTQLDVAAGVEGGLAVVLLAVHLDRCTGGLAARTRRSRSRRRPAAAPVVARPAAQR